jgi:hypothetical protein
VMSAIVEPMLCSFHLEDGGRRELDIIW